MEERGLVGLEARTADGDEFGRISEVVVDADGTVTHVIVEREGEESVLERLEVPISALYLDRDADFATFHADRSDDEPGDHIGDEVGAATEASGPDATPSPDESLLGYAPNQSDYPDDSEHEGQFVTQPTDQHEAASLEGEESTESDEASGWQDEDSTTVDSGYPRTDAYIDPDTGQDVVDPQLQENTSLYDDVRDLLNNTGLDVRTVREGVVELTGSVPSRDALDGNVEEVMGLTDVLEVDTTDVDVG